MEAADAGFLSEPHVNQLHPLPHLRAEIETNQKAARAEVRRAASPDSFYL
jgi:hypothetical protein